MFTDNTDIPSTSFQGTERKRAIQVGIAGAGAIGMGYAALLLSRGHGVGLWSPSGIRTEDMLDGAPLKVTGAISGEFQPEIRQSAAELADADVVVVALPAYGHRYVIDALLPHLEARHSVIISGHLSFSALYLYRRLEARGLHIPIIAWNTTALTCKAQSYTEIKIGTLRQTVATAVMPKRFDDATNDLCHDLFGRKFVVHNDLLSITLGNLNPQSHLAIALCNLTRFERGETWGQRENITHTVGRLIEALDHERIAIAAAFGRKVSSVFDHYRNSFGLVGSSVAELSAQQVANGADVAGPKTIDSRYVLEDVPYGVVPLVHLADIMGVEAPLHRSGLAILSACYGQNFSDLNNLLPEIDLVDPALLGKFGPHGPNRSRFRPLQ